MHWRNLDLTIAFSKFFAIASSPDCKCTIPRLLNDFSWVGSISITFSKQFLAFLNLQAL